MNRIGIVGYGALGKQVVGLLRGHGALDDLLLFDDLACAQKTENSFPFNSYLDPRFSNCDFYVALGYHHLTRKAEILAHLRDAGRRAPSFVHPTCYLHPTCHLGYGCVLYPMCNLDQEVELGDGALLNNSVVISHNCRVGQAAYFSPGVVLSGHVTVGEAAFLGSGAVVANNRRIGAGARVGIGTVVTCDVPEGASALGNPMRLLEHPLNLQ